jgi:hypothetical protein
MKIEKILQAGFHKTSENTYETVETIKGVRIQSIIETDGKTGVLIFRVSDGEELHASHVTRRTESVKELLFEWKSLESMMGRIADRW